VERAGQTVENVKRIRHAEAAQAAEALGASSSALTWAIIR